MKRILFIMLLIADSILCHSKDNLPFRKVVIWGHKLHTHTHSYIHHAFHKAFTHLGYPTYWLDSHDAIDKIDFSNTLFITEGQADAKIPIRDDCLYVLHNCTSKKYKKLYEHKKAITLQVYTHDVRTRNAVEKEPYIFYDIPNKILYMPWATDLLPHEIDAVKASLHNRYRHKTVYWIGSMGTGTFGNLEQLKPFMRACKENNVVFEHLTHIPFHKNFDKIHRAYLAPAIVGEWQQKQGYIPCRIFKNISYGHLGVTNSPAVYDLFQKKIVYNEDTYQLFSEAQKRISSLQPGEIEEVMDFVRDHHTYLNRINHLLTFFAYVHGAP